ncbi:tetratricopeptide repeat-containing sulfotransferase family protein [Oleiagrimonas sp. C23AA]|uniref:tetratricopeptide repeat-containing sulfotransferase family protein n=1 Tax=Oleiagrimonas sp. C23AA TaxID=2719047 RepID=UPI00141F49AA|nr:tetratricopeptide repeat-containing sulfotransferase family protein [Oleiagrimonas sp. C23AA]NII11960.1 tetratricopeptide repeat protein [Oleiagrimonas sp. C23AA]
MHPRLAGLSSPDIQQLVQAGQALEAGRADLASQRLAALSTQARQHPEVQRLTAGTLSANGRHRDAIAMMRQAVAQRPDDALYHNTLGSQLGHAGDFDAAITSLRKAIALDANQVDAWYNLGVILTRAVRHEEAIEALRETVRRAPGHVHAQALLADMLRTQDRTDEARSVYRDVLSRYPQTGMAWWGLADLRQNAFEADDIERMSSLLRGQLAAHDRIAIGMALAAALDQFDRLDEAMSALQQAHAEAARTQTWSADGFAQGLAMVDAAFAGKVAQAPDAQGREVIFVVGLPRSGSTLTEQILATHSQAGSAGELSDLPQVLGEESRRRGKPFPHWVSDMQPKDWQRLGQNYLTRTARWRLQASRHIDKLPNNWIYIGAINAMLPGAHIVGCQRDALETCFSVYRQHLNNNDYAHRFDDLASYWHVCRTRLERWRERAPDRVYIHDHEALLDAPEASVRALLEACDLPFEAACLQPHTHAGTVRSPSATQVRRPIERGRTWADRYGARLDRLREALRRVGAQSAE